MYFLILEIDFPELWYFVKEHNLQILSKLNNNLQIYIEKE